MQVSVKKVSELERNMSVEIPSERLIKAVDARLKELAKNVKIDGFRKGKVPASEVKRLYGTSVTQEMAEELMYDGYKEALTQEKIAPAGMPKFDCKDVALGQPIVYTASFEVFPEIKLKSLAKFKVERPLVELKDSDVDFAVEQLCLQHANWAETDAPSQDSDKLTIAFVGKMDGEAFEGGSADSFELELGKKSMIPGFEEGLLGAKAGEEVTLELNFPEQYHAKDLAGKPVQFLVTIKKVNTPVLAELNAELAKKLHVKDETPEGIRTEIRENMAKGLERTVHLKLKENVFDKFVEANAIEVPTALIDREVAQMLTQATRGQLTEKSPEFAKQLEVAKGVFSKQAKQRVALGLLFNELVEKEKLVASKKQVEEFIQKLGSSYEDPKSFLEYYLNNTEKYQEMESLVLEELATEHLMKELKIKDNAINYKDFMDKNSQ